MDSIAIISDIHGNLPALEAVLADIDARHIKNIYCLGDIVGYYCFFNEIATILDSRQIPTLMGNHDFALLNTEGVIERSKTCTHILKWQLANVQERTLRFLKTLPSQMVINHAQKSIQLVHAGLKDNIDEYLFDVSDTYFQENNFTHDVLISGHTHLTAFKRFYSGKMWLNPSSVGQPRDGNNKAAYLILDDSFNPHFIRVAYDYQQVINKMKACGFADYIAEGLKTGKKIGS
jgi:putative phosphoesterase